MCDNGTEFDNIYQSPALAVSGVSRKRPTARRSGPETPNSSSLHTRRGVFISGISIPSDKTERRASHRREKLMKISRTARADITPYHANRHPHATPL